MSRGAAKSIVLALWATFLWWLIVSGEIYRYIGPRTRWVIWFGAVCLTLVAVAYAAASIKDARSRASVFQLVTHAALVIPILLVVVIPKPSLGSLAASRKLTNSYIAAGALQPSALQPGEEVSFPEIQYASESEKYAATVGISDGYRITLTGFLSDATGGPAGTIPLTRFSMFCCAADVIPYTVWVDPGTSGSTYPRDTWLTVQGALIKTGDRYVLEAERVTRVD